MVIYIQVLYKTVSKGQGFSYSPDTCFAYALDKVNSKKRTSVSCVWDSKLLR